MLRMWDMKYYRALSNEHPELARKALLASVSGAINDVKDLIAFRQDLINPRVVIFTTALLDDGNVERLKSDLMYPLENVVLEFIVSCDRRVNDLLILSLHSDQPVSPLDFGKRDNFPTHRYKLPPLLGDNQ